MKWKSFYAAKTICFETAAPGTETKVTFKASNTKLGMKVMEPATDKPWEKCNCGMLQKVKSDVESGTGNKKFPVIHVRAFWQCSFIPASKKPQVQSSLPQIFLEISFRTVCYLVLWIKTITVQWTLLKPAWSEFCH